MLDQTGIYLAEIDTKYPRVLQTLGYDVLFDADEMSKPKVLSTFQMCVNSILMLLKMKPGQFPSIPELGIDIEQYLHEYSDDRTIPNTIKSKLDDQLNVLGYVGITVDVYNDITEDGHPALIIRISGSETLTYHQKDMQNVVVGITYNQLGQMYTRIKYIDSYT